MIIDLAESITYRGLDINTTVLGNGRVAGYTVEEVRLMPIDGVGYKEKRSLADGFDYGPVYLGKRDIFVRGVVYGEDANDHAQKRYNLLSAFNPALCYKAAPLDHGFHALEFIVPYWNPVGPKSMLVYARPSEVPGTLVLPETNSQLDSPTSSLFELRLECRDPRIYDASATTMTITDGSNNLDQTVDGNAEPPVNFVFVTGDTSDFTFTFSGFGSQFTLSVAPGFPENSIVTVDSALKIVTVKQPSLVETLRMDLITFAAGTTWPQATEGENTVTGTLTSASPLNGAYMTYREAWY